MNPSNPKPDFAATEPRSGVFHAPDGHGHLLPIIDTGHPSFALSLGPDELRARTEQFLREMRPMGPLRTRLRRALLKLFLRGSLLGEAIQRSQGTFMSGMDTYLLKLGADNLGVRAKPIDRKIAGSLPVLAVRLRLQEMATLIAETLAPALRANPGRPLRLVDIAGGPATAPLNALLRLNREEPALLAGRAIFLDVLEQDREGPAFGARSLEVLRASGGPLHGLDARLDRRGYDWTRPQTLAPLLDAAQSEGALIFASSEGGLFEYGSDEEIAENLGALARNAFAPLAVFGSVTRDDEPPRRLRANGGVSTWPRGLARFEALIEPCGWKISRALEGVFSDQVVLVRGAR